MGQEANKNQKNVRMDQIKSLFQRDPRLVQAVIFVPQLFEGVYNQQLKHLQKLKANIPYQPLFDDMVDGINQRFACKGQQNELNKQQITQFYELQKIQTFNKFLLKIQKWYHIQKQLNQVFESNEKQKTKKVTLRKKISPDYSCSIHIDLLAQLFLHYYLIVLKKNFASKQVKRKRQMQQFHDGIGKILCKMVQNNNITDDKLSQLLYKVVHIQKINSLYNFQQKLQSISQQFWPIYLGKQHSIGIPEDQYKRYKQITRCYLSELYLRSIKEAEDPDIKDQNESLGVIKNFPIMRVKQRPKLK